MGFPPFLNLSTKLSTAALVGQTTKTALKEEFMFQNVAYWPTVYRTGISPTLPNTFLLLSTFLNKIYSPFSIVTLYFLILYLRILLKSWIHAGITQEYFQRESREFVFKQVEDWRYLVAKNFVLFTPQYKRNYQIFSSPIKDRAQQTYI